MSHFTDTRVVRAGIGSDRGHRAVVPPLHLSANYVFDAPGIHGQYDYSRTGNPTRDVLADALAEAEGGAGAVVTSSGMSAVGLITHLLRPGDLLVAPHDCYGGCHRLFLAESKRVGFDVAFVDFHEPGAVDQLGVLRPSLVWIETPSNPLLRITDIGTWVRAAKALGAHTVVDNTFLSPALQRPIELGADIVVHSTTKLINGHSDVVGGAVVVKDEALHEELAWWANCLGLSGAPFDSYLTMRGFRSLAARVSVHEANALAVVEALASHPTVQAVYHPSLEAHPGHEIAAKQQCGWGSIVSFELHGGRAAVHNFVSALSHFTLAESLGGVESLIAHPATMTHASMSPEAQATAGIRQTLVRISVGIERAEDLVSDITNALNRTAVRLEVVR